MDSTTFLELVGGTMNLIVAFIIYGATGRARFRLSLGTLFLLNGVSRLVATGAPGDATLNLLAQAIDSPTGLILADVGVLLSAGALRRWEVVSGWTAAAGLVLLPLPYYVGGLAAGAVIQDATVTIGFALVAVGAVIGCHRGGSSPYWLAMLLAFVPRPLEFVLLFADALWGPSAAPPWPYAAWRLPFLAVMCLTLAYAMWRLPTLGRTALALAGALAVVVWYAQTTVGRSLALYAFTLIVARPAFVIAAVASSDDSAPISTRSLGGRLGGSVAGTILGGVLTYVFASEPQLALTLMTVGLALVGFALGGLSDPRPTPSRLVVAKDADDAPGAAFATLRPGDRLLLALVGVEFAPDRAAPSEASTGRISDTTGIAPKHLPDAARRLVTADGRPLVAVDRGNVMGHRRRNAPRYRLTADGRAAAQRLREEMGIAALPPEAIRRHLESSRRP